MSKSNCDIEANFLNSLEMDVLKAEADADEMELVVEDLKIASVTAVNEFKDTDFVKVIVEGQTFDVHKSQMHMPLSELMEAVKEERERERLTVYLQKKYEGYPKDMMPIAAVDVELLLTVEQLKNWYHMWFDKSLSKKVMAEENVDIAVVVETLLLHEDLGIKTKVA